MSKDLAETLGKYLDKRIAERNSQSPPTEEEMDDYVAEFIKQHKTMSPYVETGGYSPEEMWVLLNDTFGDESPLQLRQITEEVCEQIPLFRQIYHLLEILSSVGEIKLTQNGNLPLKVVRELYEFGVPDKMIEQDGYQFRSEVESESVPVAREIARLIGAVKKRNNKLSLTAKGKRMLADRPALATAIITTACTSFRATILDFFEEELTGEIGVGYVLLLLKKYGTEERPAEQYYFNYLEALPILYTECSDLFTFTLRMFERRLLHIGVIELTRHKTGSFETEIHITKSPLFDKLFLCLPPWYLRKTGKS